MSRVRAGGDLHKLFRFASIYGLRRSLYKAAGRLRLRVPTWRPSLGSPDIGLIGCGQFGFATIGYFLQSRFGRRLLSCYDIDPAAASSLARSLHVASVASSADALLCTPGLRTVYIASNHASHTPYAVAALDRGLDVYVEKPVAVTTAQLAALSAAQRRAKGRLFAGYNRPFSGAVRELRRSMTISAGSGISMQCFVVGHLIAPDHWYRRPEEGTRICGNVGHWLDLFVHLLHWRSLPDEIDISLSWVDAEEPDDNVSITLVSSRGDLCSIMLSARAEPFEGINESIQVQHGETICKIDDFRRMTIWQGSKVRSHRFWPKDPGHRGAILQPFTDTAIRPWREVEDSTLLMLHITDMVRQRVRNATFSFSDARAQHECPLLAH